MIWLSLASDSLYPWDFQFKFGLVPYYARKEQLELLASFDIFGKDIQITLNNLPIDGSLSESMLAAKRLHMGKKLV